MIMATGNKIAMLLLSISLLSLLLASPSAAQQQCSRVVNLSSRQSSFQQCLSLTQGATIAWTFFPNNQTLDIGFSGTLPSPSGWVGWGYNPSQARMPGTSALIAFSNSSGSHLLLYSLTAGGASSPPVPATSDITILEQDVNIANTAASFTARLRLANPSSNIFHIWNRGPGVSGNMPNPHVIPPTESLGGNIDLVSGSGSQAGIPRLRLRNAHGILNAVGWGILLPIGAMSARYLRSFEWADPTWFYLHVACQTLGYILGVVGWAIGLRLGSDSVGVRYDTHRNIGITMFVFGTLQVFAIVLRPNKTHKYRLFWNVYHHAIGYATISLAIANIFKGFDILDPARGWRNAYIGIIIALGVVALILEAITWVVYLRNRSKTPLSSSPVKNSSTRSGNPYAQQDAFNGHGSRV